MLWKNYAHVSRASCVYYPFFWTHYKKSTHSKLRVAFNNVYRRIVKLPFRSSDSTTSTMYAVNCLNNINSLDILARSKKRIFGCIERLIIFDNSIVKCITNSWVLKFDICSVWNELLYTQ